MFWVTQEWKEEWFSQSLCWIISIDFSFNTSYSQEKTQFLTLFNKQTQNLVRGCMTNLVVNCMKCREHHGTVHKAVCFLYTGCTNAHAPNAQKVRMHQVSFYLSLLYQKTCDNSCIQLLKKEMHKHFQELQDKIV